MAKQGGPPPRVDEELYDGVFDSGKTATYKGKGGIIMNPEVARLALEASVGALSSSA